MSASDAAGPEPGSDPDYAAKLARAAGTVAGWLGHLIAPDQVVELRALRVADGTRGGSTWAGTFRGDELPALAAAALGLSGLCQGVYYTLNPLRPGRYVRQAPRVQRVAGQQLACDADVLERRWLLIDIDPVKPGDHKDDSAADDEKARTLAMAGRIREYLAGEGWPAPVVVDSGNGHHLLYRVAGLPVELPLKDDDRMRRVLVHLAAKFGGPDGKVDTAVYNPGRIVKFPGTLACKGEASETRPHRRARVLEVPE
jgi:hypothetical protein